MNNKTIINITAFLSLLIGSVINFAFSGMLVWGNAETLVLRQQTADAGLKLHCPILIAPFETAEISTTITNTEGKAVKPVIVTQLSYQKDLQSSTETITLEPGESTTIHRTADRSNLLFDEFIAVIITQRQYVDLISRQGACSIFVYSLFGWSGRATLMFILTISALLNLVGALGLWWNNAPLPESKKNIAQAIGLLMFMSIAGVIAVLIRFWALTILFDVIAALGVVTIITNSIFHRNS
jgi:hypothetical protein